MPYTIMPQSSHQNPDFSLIFGSRNKALGWGGHLISKRVSQLHVSVNIPDLRAKQMNEKVGNLYIQHFGANFFHI